MTKPKQTKTAKVQSMLRRPSGATIDALCKATGWQAHSVRAALTGLRKAGHAIAREEADGKTGKTVFRIIAPAETPS
ncbi:DUF3489 domain-containing protein [Aestuariicoccus sp. MJ-SS9]|uniref:DUF3489 domain-containing protein n=1 Tax=Aestuariicoccus sp. MJ-SS9 TaxID=3079855 RepID=UPI00290AF2FE|nr:DUF3489 domain-containing protein [Aestuariicoccus sp. MJ-SS9]MDU8912246.1 DUF3489 domain-containing protein [Aestuariicoccus sp. MJ-SS9]